MATERANDLRALRDFADARLTGEGSDPTLDEALALRQLENEPGQQRDDAVHALREAFDDMAEGDEGTPVVQVTAALRSEFNLTPGPRSMSRDS